MEQLFIFSQYKNQHLTIKLTAFKQKVLILNKAFFAQNCSLNSSRICELVIFKAFLKFIINRNKYNHRVHAIVIKNLHGKYILTETSSHMLDLSLKDICQTREPATTFGYMSII